MKAKELSYVCYSHALYKQYIKRIGFDNRLTDFNFYHAYWSVDYRPLHHMPSILGCHTTCVKSHGCPGGA